MVCQTKKIAEDIEQHDNGSSAVRIANPASPPLNDMLSQTLREHSNIPTLLSTFTICACMILVTILRLAYFPIVSEAQTLLQLQIPILKNLIHAALLAVAALLIHVHGQILALFFVRYVAFFFGLTALSHTIVDLVTLVRGHNLMMDNSSLAIRLIPETFMTLSSLISFVSYGHSIRLLQDRVQEYHSESRRATRWCSVVILNGIRLGMFSIVLYMVGTTIGWLSSEPKEHDEGSCHGKTHSPGMDSIQHHPVFMLLMKFEKSYTFGAHVSFVMALIRQASIFPLDTASIGGALIAASWRFLTAIGYAYQFHSVATVTARSVSAGILTGLELCFIVPVWFAIVNLCLIHCPTCPEGSWNSSSSSKENDMLNLVVAQEEDSDSESSQPSDDNHLDDLVPSPPIVHFTSLSEISMKSHLYTRDQLQGVYLLLFGSRTIFVCYTAEIFLILRSHSVGFNQASFELYGWGMHVCVIYLFCTVLCVQNPTVYQYGRVILACACPTGSVLALWQLWIFAQGTRQHGFDSADVPFFLLISTLCGRALGGLLQTIGIVLLDRIVEFNRRKEKSADKGSLVQSSVTSAKPFSTIRETIKQSRTKIMTVLLGTYIPTVSLIVWNVATSTQEGLPLLSPDIPFLACHGTSPAFLQLSPHLPGMGIYFHFGLLVVQFTADSLLNTPAYGASPFIVGLFAKHAGLLGVSHAISGMLFESIEGGPLWTQVVVLLWAGSCAYLSYCLEINREDVKALHGH